MNDPLSVMPPDTAAMFKLVQSVAFLNEFVLIGGTALALHIGHRKSEDLDFITPLHRLPRDVLAKLAEIICKKGHSIFHDDEEKARNDFENAGMDLHDYSQNWLIDDKVKITFFAADEHHKRILIEPNPNEGFRLGSLEELSALKALVACERSKTRDWLDLFVLEQNYGFGLTQWKAAYDKAGLGILHFNRALDRICSGGPSLLDEGFAALLPDPPSLNEIVSRFRELRAAYDAGLAG